MFLDITNFPILSQIQFFSIQNSNYIELHHGSPTYRPWPTTGTQPFWNQAMGKMSKCMHKASLPCVERTYTHVQSSICVSVGRLLSWSGLHTQAQVPATHARSFVCEHKNPLHAHKAPYANEMRMCPPLTSPLLCRATNWKDWGPLNYTNNIWSTS